MNKRFFDILLSIVLLPIILPLMLLLSIILVFELKQFPFFAQDRGIALDKFRIKIIKLRTIKRTSKDKYNSSKNVFFKPGFVEDVPKFAEWLRRTGLDEIPQIFNIIKGDMSFVGPRPFMISDLKLLKNNDWKYYKIRRSLNSKPGVTGLWQIFCNREEGAKNLVALETIYEEMKSVKYDIKILLYTLPIILTANNVDSIFCSSSFPVASSISSSNITEIEILFGNNKLFKTDNNSEYKIKLPGDWWTEDRSIGLGDRNNTKLKLLNVNTVSKKTA